MIGYAYTALGCFPFVRLSWQEVINFGFFLLLRFVVSYLQNFDEVLVPADHVSRSYNDTYYVDSQTVLRCHTSAHQAELLRNGHTHFLVTGDVYRRDSIDATHYPVFHQVLYLQTYFSLDMQIVVWIYPLMVFCHTM